MSANPFDRNDTHWKVLSDEIAFDAPPFLRVNRQHIKTPEGLSVDDFYQVDLPSFAIAIPILEDGGILTQWQYKHGARQYSLTFPAGHINAGETPEDAMRRELLEETGYVAGEAVHLGACAVNANQGCGLAHMMVLKDCRKQQEPDHNDIEAWDLRIMDAASIDEAAAQGGLAILSQFAVWYAARARKIV